MLAFNSIGIMLRFWDSHLFHKCIFHIDFAFSIMPAFDSVVVMLACCWKHVNTCSLFNVHNHAAYQQHGHSISGAETAQACNSFVTQAIQAVL